MDFIISSYLNSFLKYDIIAEIVYLMADFPIFFIPIFCLIAWLYFNYKKDNSGKIKLLNILYWIILCVIINIIIQHIHFVERPMQSLQNAWKLILEHIPNASFPSDHAWVSISFLTWLFLFWFRKFFIIALPFFVLMNLSRIAWGIHWTTDILAWWIIWIFTSFIVYKFQNLNIINKINNFFIKIANFFKL